MRAARSLPASLLSASSGFVEKNLGLRFPPERRDDLERALVSAARELGHSEVEGFVRRLLSFHLSEEEIEVVTDRLTVGETYFFREKDTLEAFEQRVLPELLRAHRGGERHLRIWSAGCCTGEEPYTIAMILDRFLPEPEPWNLTLLATDVSPRFLRKAAEGVYGEWSFRATPAAIRERYFRKRGAGRWEIDPKIRSRVTFSCLNLATDAYPSLVNNTNAMDAIFCRNVLMYFAANQAREVLRKFRLSLVSGGWLIVSAVETSNETCFPLVPVQSGRATLYRETDAAESETAPWKPAVIERAPSHLTRSVSPPGLPVRPVPLEPPSIRPLFPAPEEHEPTTAEMVSRARRCANEGRLDDALRWCQQAIAADRTAPLHHYLLSVIQQEMGQTDAAVRSLGRALYLDHDFVLAHFCLANIELSRGRRAVAERHLSNTLAALRAQPAEETLPEADGLTAGRLAEIVASLLESIPREPATVRVVMR